MLKWTFVFANSFLGFSETLFSPSPLIKFYYVNSITLSYESQTDFMQHIMY